MYVVCVYEGRNARLLTIKERNGGNGSHRLAEWVALASTGRERRAFENSYERHFQAERCGLPGPVWCT